MAVPDLAAAFERWPRFARAAWHCGFSEVHAVPMRRRSEVIGALNLFGTGVGAVDEDTLRLGQALADVATIGILQARAAVQRDALAAQLQTTVNNRVVIEQAKGVIAERRHLDMDQALVVLRTRARNGNREMSAVARAIVEGTEDL